jgi:PAS domain S-box-containing protein
MKNRNAVSDLIFVLIIIFLAFASVISYLRVTKQNDASYLVLHNNLIRNKLGELLTYTRESVRNFEDIILKSDSSIGPMLLADSLEISEKSRGLDSLSREETGEHARILEINSLHEKWAETLLRERLIARSEKKVVMDLIDANQMYITRIQAVISEMRHNEDDILYAKVQARDRSAFLTPLYSLLLSFLAITFVALIYFRLRHETQLRMKAEDAQALIHHFFQQVPVSLAILKGPEHIFEFANPFYRALIGGRDPVNQTVRQALPEGAGQDYYELLDSVYKTGKSFIGKEMPVQIKTEQGLQQVYLDFIYQAFKNPSGETDGILVFCYDVSEKVLTRNLIRDAENRSRLAIDAAKMGTFDWDLQNQQFISSPRLIEIFGYHDILNTSHQDLIDRFHPEDKPIRDEAVKNSYSTGSMNYEARIVWPDGSVHWLNVLGKILSDNALNILRMYGTVVDITSQKNFLEELEKKVFERTQSLNETNLALEQSVGELQQSNAELASFNYIASHDLQEPLRKIIAFSKRIEEIDQQALSRTAKDYFNRIIQATTRMQNLINAFLSYSQTTNISAAMETVDLNKVFREVKNDFSDKIEQKNVSIESKSLPIIAGIPLQISQVFTNLIGNAIKYSRTGIDPKIEILSEKCNGGDLPFEGADAKAEYWKIGIVDNGIGFDQAYRHQIFELFQRLHNRQEYAGTGIGLAICKKIMRNHKGFISATGTKDAGATFSIYFPV